MFHECEGGITAAGGFTAAGIHCGIKKQKKDLALLVSETPALAAGVFTTSRTIAPPVHLSRRHLETSQNIYAVIINSGNANACTGDRGMTDALTMASVTAKHLGVSAEQVLVASTGVIGEFLPMDKVVPGIEQIMHYLSKNCHLSSAEAIMTTDTFTKEVAVRTNIGGTVVTIGGMAKGSGMIAPNMATMLGFVTTDVRISRSLLQEALRTAADRSFNCISVDGDTSTNDMVAILANGTAGNPEIQNNSSVEYREFYEALEYVLIKLARMIVVDGEGATKLVEIRIKNAASELAARTAARSIANSNLVKTAIHGADANWGRILVALGYSGIDFNPSDTEVFFGDVPILRKNYTIQFSEEAARKELEKNEVHLTVDLNQGNASARFWTCDLSKEYITINAHYRT
jgi:glutamate N-acetyltransferase / amino-acid N-acetyltransferase